VTKKKTKPITLKWNNSKNLSFLSTSSSSPKSNFSNTSEKKTGVEVNSKYMQKKVSEGPEKKPPENFIKKNMRNLRQSKEEKAKPKPALRKI